MRAAKFDVNSYLETPEDKAIYLESVAEGIFATDEEFKAALEIVLEKYGAAITWLSDK